MTVCFWHLFLFNMKQFKIRQGGFKEIKRQILIRTVPFMCVVAAAGIAMGSINSKKKDAGINVLPIVITFAAISIGAGIYKSIGRQEGLFNSFKLTITDNLITREQLN